MVDLLHEHGFATKRLAQAGINDAGDLDGESGFTIAGGNLLIECKKWNNLRLPEWIRKAKKKNPNWVILYADDRRLADSIGTIAILPAEMFVGMLSLANDMAKQVALASVLRPLAGGE